MRQQTNPEPKPSKARFHVLDPDGEAEIYAFLKDQRQHHPELDRAVIRLVWLLGVTPSLDGHVTLGKAIKAPPLWQQATGIDWFIGLNREYWMVADDPQRSYLVDHELCHMAPSLDKYGEQKIDDHGFHKWRTVKHDIGEFPGPVQRHGIRMGDLHRFLLVATRAQRTLPFTTSGAEVDPSFEGVKDAVENLRPKAGSDIESVTISSGGKSVTLERPAE